MVRAAFLMLALALMAGLARAETAPDAPAAAEPGVRVALLIGNGAYAHVPDLANPPRDTALLAETLAALDFEVTEILDADYQGLRVALRDFGERAAEADVALVYYAGHGIEIEGRNFMIPVDATLADSRDVEFETVPLELFQRAADPARRMSLVILDACRNNPFLAQMAGRTRSVSRGLALVEPVGSNRLVAYAAKEGTVADDGAGDNSPYAEALAEALAEPGLEIGKLFRRVRDRVHAATGGEQEPALYGSLSEQDFYFLPPPGDATGTAAAEASVEAVFWASIADSEDPADFEDFLRRFPDSAFRGLAVRRLERFGGDARVAARDATGEAGSAVRGTGAGAEQPAVPFRPTPDAVRTVQARLNALGFDAGPVDGILGRRTAGAIRAWQRGVGLAPDGRLDGTVWQRLTGRPPAPAAAGAVAAAPAPVAAEEDWPLGKWCEAEAASFLGPRCVLIYRYDDGVVTVNFLEGGDPAGQGCVMREAPGRFLVRTGLRPHQCAAAGEAGTTEAIAMVLEGGRLELGGRVYLR